MAENEHPQRPSAEPQGNESGRRRRPGWFPLLLVLIILAGSAGSILAMRQLLGVDLVRGGFVQSTQRPDEAQRPNQTQRPEATEQAEETAQLPRAPLGSGVTMTLAPAAEGQLTLQEIYQKAIPSVVSVEGDISVGTGVIFDSNGYILTNYHVVADNQKISIYLQDSSRYDAALVGGDAKSDLAVLKIDATGLPTAEFGDSSALQVGDLAVAIGNPLGVSLRGTMTDGIISAINRNVTVDGRVMTLIQTNAALNAGNSGGPLLNSEGQVIGINNLKMSSMYTPVEGLGFAIPTALAKPIVDTLLQKGEITYAVVGITVLEIPNEEYPVEIQEVNQTSDAWAKGLRPGDCIISCNGQPVNTITELDNAKKDGAVGDTITLTVSRKGETLTFQIVLVDEDGLTEAEG